MHLDILTCPIPELELWQFYLSNAWTEEYQCRSHLLLGRTPSGPQGLPLTVIRVVSPSWVAR